MMRNNKLVIGICAHVDAGKTTLAEGLLYTCGQLRKLGRVDHGDAFLDNFSLERERGITIFSKQAQISYEGLDITLLDTPGHVDFSAEMERTLQVMDYCLLVISGADGVQGHVQTLWRLLKQYGIPTFLFVNKMDQPGTDREQLLRELQSKLDGSCVEFGAATEMQGMDAGFWEEISLCDESLMEEYLESGTLSGESVAEAIANRRVFPVLFGAALHLQGVEELLRGIRQYTKCREYPDEFGARVYKISRDAAGNRLTHLKVTGGVLKVKMLVDNGCSAVSEGEKWEEKADQLRVYGGASFQAVDSMEAGGICAVKGLTRTFAGQGLGFETVNEQPVLVPVLTYGLVLPEGADPITVLGQLRKLEEEEPQLHVVWKEAVREIHVQVMGEVQIEILKRLIQERFGLAVEFADGHIVYKETIAEPVVGIGHYEPLRHYAEVHLLMEPGEAGSGLQLATACSEDVLDRNWQRLIFTHLEEKTHLGVLTGSPVTDMKVTLLTGRAHLKHTEGGDFRQATYRALRQGLMQAKNVLLEPVFAFSLEIPTEQLGRAMNDIQRMCGKFDAPQTLGEITVLTGSAPVAAMRGYQREVNAYTRGHGRLTCTLKGYEPCHNTEEVLEQMGYEPEADLENPASSVFCAHGAGFVVDWEKVPEYAHLENGWNGESGFGRNVGNCDEESSLVGGREAGEGYDGGNYVKAYGNDSASGVRARTGSWKNAGRSDYISQEEIEAIFQQTYRKSKQDYEPYRYHQQNTGGMAYGADFDRGDSGGTGSGGLEAGGGNGHNRKKTVSNGTSSKREEYLLVDGYNIIFAWDDLRALAEVNIDSARDKLMDICSNYQGFKGCTLILVYDAYKVKGNTGSVQKYHNIYVVYTKEAETADQYIEKTVHEIGRKHDVTVATSDALEQMIIWGDGAVRLSARGFREAVENASKQLREEYMVQESKLRNRPFAEAEIAEVQADAEV